MVDKFSIKRVLIAVSFVILLGFSIAIVFVIRDIFTDNNTDTGGYLEHGYPLSWDVALKKTNCPFFIDGGADYIHGHASLPQGTIFGIKSTSTPKYYVAISEPTRLFISTFTDLIPYHECFKTTAEAEAAGYEDAGTMDGISAPLEAINQGGEK